MSIETFEKREAILDLKEKLLVAEEQRLYGEKTISRESAIEKSEIKLRHIMNYDVEILPEADRDLEDIFDYILYDS